MAAINNLFKEKVYITQESRSVFGIEKDIIDSISLEVFNKNSKIEFIDANKNYDLFKITNDHEFYLKLSLTDPHQCLEKEFSVLNENSYFWHTPFPYKYGKLKNFGNVIYALYGAIPTQNIKNYGIADALNNIQSYAEMYESISNFSSINFKIPLFDQYLNHYLEFDIFKVPDINIDSLESSPYIKNIAKTQTVELQKILKEKLQKINFSQKHFCHGNLNQSTILPIGESMACINFDNCYWGDCLFEILNLKYNLFFSEKIENEIIKFFKEIDNEKLNLSQLREYRNFVCYWNLLKICVDYLEEVFILKSYRQAEILNIAFRFSKNYNNFYQLPNFDKNFKPIAELFVESVI